MRVCGCLLLWALVPFHTSVFFFFIRRHHCLPVCYTRCCPTRCASPQQKIDTPCRWRSVSEGAIHTHTTQKSLSLSLLPLSPTHSYFTGPHAYYFGLCVCAEDYRCLSRASLFFSVCSSPFELFQLSTDITHAGHPPFSIFLFACGRSINQP